MHGGGGDNPHGMEIPYSWDWTNLLVGGLNLPCLSTLHDMTFTTMYARQLLFIISDSEIR